MIGEKYVFLYHFIVSENERMDVIKWVQNSLTKYCIYLISYILELSFLPFSTNVL